MHHHRPNLLLSKAHVPAVTIVVAIIVCHQVMPDLQLPKMVHALVAITAVVIIV